MLDSISIKLLQIKIQKLIFKFRKLVCSKLALYLKIIDSVIYRI